MKIHKRQKYCVPCMELVKSSNLPAYRAWNQQYQRERTKRVRRENPAKAISERITAQIGHAIRGKKAGRKWESIVGYSVKELMDHLERQFLKGMSWENRSSWHIDHIVPLTSFTFSGVDDPELKRAWALTNLRPLWAADNVRKSDQRTHLL
ncbi:hypothetical protein [Noviherbaspirillum suwonense]|uniref:hypothetical protein n=1 Tax=Noviherbaspirillum suwonense TaxID=1224511 RepID=UPI0024B6EC03|nr:hypothetical protein [Noviherbaspirillum suwonense]